jgi:hypothetical protein
VNLARRNGDVPRFVSIHEATTTGDEAVNITGFRRLRGGIVWIDCLPKLVVGCEPAIDHLIAAPNGYCP